MTWVEKKVKVKQHKIQSDDSIKGILRFYTSLKNTRVDVELTYKSFYVTSTCEF